MRAGARRERGFRVEAAVLAVLGLVALGAWWWLGRAPKRFNLVLISIDSLRQDHVGCYGYPKPTTPNLDRLAARGARFETMHSSTTWTLPAHLTLMTGLPDDVHQVVLDPVPFDSKHRVMLAEVLRDAGYATGGAFGGLYLLPRFGFGDGFDVYQNCGVPHVDAASPPSAERESHRIQTAPRLQAAAEAFLDTVDDEPFFLFLHHWDVHYDYIAPQEYVDLFAGDYEGNLDVRDFYVNPAIHAGMAPADLAYVKACYDAEIRFVDDHVGKLLDDLERRGLTDSTYVVVVSDHGEEFFEHGNKGHRLNLHEETLRVPWIVAGPGIAPGTVIEDQARLMDVMPTVLGLLDLPEGAAEAFGESFAARLLGTGAGPRELPLVAELTYVPKVRDPDSGAWREAEHFEKHQAFGFRDGKMLIRHVRRYDPRRPLDFAREALGPEATAIYDLAADPGEVAPLDPATSRYGELLQRVRKNQSKLMEGWLDLLPTEANPKPLDLRDLRAMKDQLGY